MKKTKKLIAGLLFIALNIFLFTESALAEDITWQRNNAAILSNNSVFEDGLRWIAWGITKLLCLLADVAESLYDKTFGMIDITKYPQIENLITAFEPVLVALIVLCLIGLGLSYIVMQQKKQLVRNIMIAGLVLSSSVYMFSTANTLITSFKSAVLDETAERQSYEIVNNNLIDLVGIDKEGQISILNYRSGEGIIHNAGVVDESSINDVNLREVLNYSDKKLGQDLYGWSETFNNYLKYKVINTYGSYVSAEVYDGVLTSTIGNEFYYRYSFDFWSCLFELLAIALVYLALSYKNVRIAYELIISRFLAFFFSADIGNGERLKQILFFIRDTYIALCISIMSVKVFLLLTAAITSFGITGLGKGIVVLFIAYAVIDGPNISERILGIDAGLSSSVGRTMAVLGLAKSGAKIAAFGANSVRRAGMAAVTGRTEKERKERSGYATLGEKFGKFMHGKYSKNMNGKDGENRPGTKKECGSSDFMSDTQFSPSERKQTEEARASKSKSDYMDADFMNKTDANGSEAYVNRTHNDLGIGESRSVKGSFDAQEKTGNKSKVLGQKSDYSDADFMNKAASNGSEAYVNRTHNDLGIGESRGVKGSFDVQEKTGNKSKVSNPVFSKAVRDLSPDRSASVGERRDFNRQVNNIVRGDHKAIKPDEKSRAAYKETNYRKALILEKAYHSKGKGEGNNGKK